MTFTSVIITNESHIVEPKISGNGKAFKVLEGALLAGEYERAIGSIGMIIGEKEFRGQIYMDNISFATSFSSSDNSRRSPLLVRLFSLLLTIF
jgi:hypothetical protein